MDEKMSTQEFMKVMMAKFEEQQKALESLRKEQESPKETSKKVSSTKEKSDFSFKVEEQLVALSKPDKDGMTLEFNLVSFNSGKAMYDIRKWNEDHTKMGKGVRFDANAADLLMKALQSELEEGAPFL